MSDIYITILHNPSGKTIKLLDDKKKNDTQLKWKAKNLHRQVEMYVSEVRNIKEHTDINANQQLSISSRLEKMETAANKAYEEGDITELLSLRFKAIQIANAIHTATN